ncbi:MAG: alpha/beta fold hydrolase [Anaerolineales bacterium]|nr:alpha/beta fold hydrolase [Anaerolineales bacterium]
MTHVPTVSSDGRTIHLRDGRLLGYAEYGDPQGQPILYFNGYPGTRFEGKLISDAAARAGVRLIGLDRPGMGLSDFQPGRRMLDWPDDVIEFADALGVGRFSVVGVSGGGPFSAACAFKIPGRLRACGIIAGTGPMDPASGDITRSNRVMGFVAQRLQLLFRVMMWWSLGRFRQDRERLEAIIEKQGQQLPERDRRLFGRPEIRAFFVEEAAEAFRQGARGPAWEGKLLFGEPWGFIPEDISMERVYLWHGELDANVPVSMGRAMAERIPHCEARFYPDEAHLSLLLNHAEEILATLS